MKRILIPSLLILCLNLKAQTHNSDVDITGDIKLGKVGVSGNLKIRRGSDGNVAGIIGFLGGGTESNNLSITSSSGGGYITFRTNNGGLDERLRISNNGNVGIGTTSPSSKISIRNVGGTDGVKLLDFSEVNDEEFIFRGNFLNTGPTGNKLILGSGVSGWAANIMTWRGDGNVGIGTTSPLEKMHIESGALQFYGLGTNNNVDVIKIAENATADEFSLVGMFAGSGETGNSMVWKSMWQDNLLVLRGDGNVGIGISNPDSKLVVDGKIRSEEVKVEIINGPDYVFEEDYELRSLEETKAYISENKHLPEIPSAKEMEADGIDIGDMNMKLLKKIEELTLYQIQLLEKVEAQGDEMQKMKIELEKLKN